MLFTVWILVLGVAILRSAETLDRQAAVWLLISVDGLGASSWLALEQMTV